MQLEYLIATALHWGTFMARSHRIWFIQSSLVRFCARQQAGSVTRGVSLTSMASKSHGVWIWTVQCCPVWRVRRSRLQLNWQYLQWDSVVTRIHGGVAIHTTWPSDPTT